MTGYQTQNEAERALSRSRAETLLLLGPAAVLLVLGAILSAHVRGSELLPGELTVTRWLAGIDSSTALRVSDYLDYISEFEIAPVVFAALLPVVLLVWGQRALLVFAVSGSLTAITAVANISNRAPPTEDLRLVETANDAGGYPSGHVVYGVMVFGMLAYIAFSYMRPGIGRTAIIVLMIAIAVLMGPSRIVELDHWPADVVGSYLLSLPFLMALVWLDRRPQMQSGGKVYGQVLRTKAALVAYLSFTRPVRDRRQRSTYGRPTVAAPLVPGRYQRGPDPLHRTLFDHFAPVS